jgi:hypothetical protein
VQVILRKNDIAKTVSALHHLRDSETLPFVNQNATAPRLPSTCRTEDGLQQRVAKTGLINARLTRSITPVRPDIPTARD